MRYTRKAFTLVELLVSIGIICILIAIILPMVNKSREQARLAGCMSNQHEVFVALQSFWHGHDEASPGVCGIIPAGGPGTIVYTGAGQLTSTSDSLPQATIEQTSRSVLLTCGYLKSTAVFHCPQQDSMQALQLEITQSPANFQYVFSDFFVGDMPCALAGVPIVPNFLPVYSSRFPSFQAPNGPIRFSRSLRQERCVLITEDGLLQDWSQSYFSTQPIQYTHATPWHVIRAHKSTDRLWYIVADAAVCTYLDGHTELVYVEVKDGIANYVVRTDQEGIPN